MSRWRAARRIVLGLGLAALLAGGCATDSAPATPGTAGAPAPPPEVRQMVEVLRGQVADLRADVEFYRRQAVTQQQLLGVRQELQAVQAALEALVRDMGQRHLEAVQTLERRIGTLGNRLDDILAARAGEVARRDPTPAVPVAPPPAAAPTPPPAASRTAAAPPPASPPPAAAPTPPPAAPRTAAAPPPAAPAPSVEPATPGTTRLVRIRRVHPTQAGGETVVSVEADGPVAPRAFTLADPPRLVVDFDNAVFVFDRTPVVVGSPLVDRIRFIQLKGAPTPVVRILMSLVQPAPHWIEPHPAGLNIHVGSEGPRR